MKLVIPYTKINSMIDELNLEIEDCHCADEDDEDDLPILVRRANLRSLGNVVNGLGTKEEYTNPTLLAELTETVFPAMSASVSEAMYIVEGLVTDTLDTLGVDGLYLSASKKGIELSTNPGHKNILLKG